MADNNLDNVRRELTRAGHAPGYVYSSPEIFQKEIDAYFMRDWLFVGRVEELAKPGDYMTMRLVGEPIIIARSREGALHAYYNMCVHRGVEVAEGKGNTRAFKCPYHGWVYDLEGKLAGAAHMKDSEGFDLSSCRMRPIRLDVWRGSIFVCFNAETPPLQEFMSQFDEDFGFMKMENCRLGNRIALDLNCNWKYVSENLMDFYHVNVLHAKTFGAKFSWENDNVVLGKNGSLTIWYKAAPPTPGGEPLLGKMPWLEDRDYSFACTGFLQPNLTIFGRIDCVRFFVVWPISESRSQVIIYHLFPEEVFERPDIEKTLKVYHDYQIAVLDEDRSMMESMQKAMSTRGYVPGRMSILEKPLHHYLNGHLDRVFGRADAQP
ncbi:aromatic ring-hydroxylating oxygenase subunit alpha [Roseomonas chloroacetimidivorans]|uniref:aromatic ring-hydroxylating oxygenase subunit alpha n=1 Tax=Roseomonas chloroacetimidivorans TaxID=1766656 RepID=UPI003C727B82